MSVRRWAAVYFASQGVAVILWWLLLILHPPSRSYFQMQSSPDATLLAFWLPDLALLAPGSLVASYLCFRGHRLELFALWFVSGAVSYAGLYCLAFALVTDAAWLGVALMLPAVLLSVASTLAVSALSVKLFRQARPASAAWNLAKTGIQIVIFWGVLLFLVPHLIARIEGRLGLTRLVFPSQRACASIMFFCFSCLGLWSGFTMTRSGSGTPLPLDSPRRLVVAGPYAYVRNPMAVAAFSQGFAVGLWLGSVSVIVYVLIGVWIWQCLVRPLEEEDLLLHFGPPYEEYRREVRCWWPRLKPYAG
ncbi:MAG: methyltransferase family protein [Blastocatellia bacterium]